MARICSVCDKGRMGGNLVSHSHRKTPRTWKPNLHKVKAVSENGSVDSVYVCSKCLKAGKVKRA
jgi:large subunit ribosomal protein L28